MTTKIKENGRLEKRLIDIKTTSELSLTMIDQSVWPAGLLEK